MTTASDLRDLRDALDCIAHGALPTWFPPDTRTGEEAQAAARMLYAQYIAALRLSSAGRVATERAAQLDDEHRAHCEALTAESERLRADIENLRAHAARTIAQVVEDCAALEGQSGSDPDYLAILERAMGVAI